MFPRLPYRWSYPPSNGHYAALVAEVKPRHQSTPFNEAVRPPFRYKPYRSRRGLLGDFSCQPEEFPVL